VKTGGGVCLRTYVYEEEPDVNYVERVWFPWQWLDEDIELLKLEVGGDCATMGLERSTKSGKKKSTGDEPRQHWTDIHCGHLGIGKLFCAVDCPVVSERQPVTHENITSERKGAYHIPEPAL
jgi:hypothetical protein